MNQNSRLLAWIGLGLLAFSLLLAPWFGPSTLVEVMNNLYHANQNAGMQTGTLKLFFEFLSLYLLAAGLTYFWYLASRDLAVLPPVIYGLLGLLGGGLALASLSSGTVWVGALSAAAGFVSLGLAGWQQAARQAKSLTEAAQVLTHLWRGLWQKATRENIPLGIAVCQSSQEWQPREREWLRQALRTTDQIFFYKGGAILLLWDVDQDQAQAALRHLIGKRNKRHFGLALWPQDGQDLETLIRHAAYAQNIAAKTGATLQSASAIQLPAALRDWLDPQNTGITYAAGLFQLQHAWQDVGAGPWQAYALTFQPPALGAVIEDKLKRLLRGSDLIVQVTPTLILVILPATDAAAGERMLTRLRNALDSESIHKIGTVQIVHHPGAAGEDWQDLVRRFWPDGQPD